jgi:hypothetical protein
VDIPFEITIGKTGGRSDFTIGNKSILLFFSQDDTTPILPKTVPGSEGMVEFFFINTKLTREAHGIYLRE